MRREDRDSHRRCCVETVIRANVHTVRAFKMQVGVACRRAVQLIDRGHANLVCRRRMQPQHVGRIVSPWQRFNVRGWVFRNTQREDRARYDDSTYSSDDRDLSGGRAIVFNTLEARLLREDVAGIRNRSSRNAVAPSAQKPLGRD